MTCPRCYYNNREKAKFCKECGMPLNLEDIGSKQPVNPNPDSVHIEDPVSIADTPVIKEAEPEVLPVVEEPVIAENPVHIVYQPEPKPSQYNISKSENVADKLNTISELLNSVVELQKDITTNMPKESDVDSLKSENATLKQIIEEQTKLIEEKDNQLKENAETIKMLKLKIPKEYVCPTCHKVYSSPVKFCSECGTQM